MIMALIFIIILTETIDIEINDDCQFFDYRVNICYSAFIDYQSLELHLFRFIIGIRF